MLRIIVKIRKMLQLFTTIYTFEIGIIMLLGVVITLCFSAISKQEFQLTQICNEIRYGLIGFRYICSGEWGMETGYKEIIIPQITRYKFLTKDYFHWLG